MNDACERQREAASDWAIEAQALCKGYSRPSGFIPVLRGVNLRIRKGECVMLAGPSGSGKSTLLALFGCLLTPDGGELRVLGCDLRSLTETERMRLRRFRMGFVFQRHHLIRGLSVLENVVIPLKLRGLRPDEQVERAHGLLKEVDLTAHANADPRRLSVGQCQRVGLARALVGDPEIIFADEPTASLDDVGGKQVVALLKRLVQERGKTAVVVTHDPRILPFADRVCHLQCGRLTGGPFQGGPPEEEQQAAESAIGEGVLS